MPPKRTFPIKEKSRVDKNKLLIEISPEELLVRLQPINLSEFANETKIKIELNQRRRELYSLLVPLNTTEHKRIFTSYEIEKLANEIKIDKLESAVRFNNLELETIRKSEIKRQKLINIEDVDEEDDDVILELDVTSDKEDSDDSTEKESENISSIISDYNAESSDESDD